MCPTGETVQIVVLIPIDNINVQWNLGKGVVVKTWESEPAKKDNEIVTIPHNKQIFNKDIDRNDVV